MRGGAHGQSYTYSDTFQSSVARHTASVPNDSALFTASCNTRNGRLLLDVAFLLVTCDTLFMVLLRLTQL